MPSTAASIAARFIFMKSVSVLSRSKMMARITRFRPDREEVSRRGRSRGRALARHGSRAGQRRPVLLGRGTYRAAQADLTIVDADVEAACGVGADPGLVGDRGAISAVVRKWDQDTGGAFPAVRKIDFHLPGHTPPPHRPSHETRSRVHQGHSPPRGN